MKHLRMLALPLAFVAAFPAFVKAQVIGEVPQQVADCDDAVQWMEQKTNWLGRSKIEYDFQVTELPETDCSLQSKSPLCKKFPKSRVIHAHKVGWVYDTKKSSSITRQLYWPSMSDAETAAMVVLRSAILEHELGHHRHAIEVLAKRTVLVGGKLTDGGLDSEGAIEVLAKQTALMEGQLIGRGRDSQAAEADLVKKTEEYIQKTHEEVDAEAFEDGAYDKRTTHGRTQSVAGGQNTVLVCPKPSRMTLPEEWEDLFPGSGSSGGEARSATNSIAGDNANIREGLAALTSTEAGRSLMASGNQEFVQGVCAARLALNARQNSASDRYFVAKHVNGSADRIVWPLHSPKDFYLLLAATGSYQQTMASAKVPSDSDPEERGLFLGAAIASLWHEIARAKFFPDQSTTSSDRGVKAWIADQVKDPSSIYSCFR